MSSYRGKVSQVKPGGVHVQIPKFGPDLRMGPYASPPGLNLQPGDGVILSRLERDEDLAIVAKVSGTTRVPEVYNVLDYGARGDGTTDDRAAIEAAILDASHREGGIVVIPAGVYLVSSPVGLFGEDWTGYPQALPEQVVGVALRGVGSESVIFRATGEFPVLAGYFYGCTIEGITFDEDGHGESCAVVQLDQTTIQNCRFQGHGSSTAIYPWAPVAGLRVNDGVWDGAGTGYLIRIHRNVIEPPPQAGWYSYGISKGYLMSDSWFTENYVESSEANVIAVGAGIRWIGNHFDGAHVYDGDPTVYRPRHNILVTYGINHNIFAHNIFEETREENFKFVAANGLADLDVGLLLSSNLFAKGSSSSIGTYPAIYVAADNAGAPLKGVTIVGNVFNRNNAGIYGWSYPVHLKWCDEIGITGNDFHESLTGGKGVRLESCGSYFDLTGNGGRNGYDT